MTDKIDAAQPLTVSGILSKKDIKRLTNLTRGGTVGPTVVYYAGVTAPVISAGMALMTKQAFELAGMVPYWKWFASSMIAAFAGIAWYMIFTRWSYRHKHGRGTEVTEITDIAIDEKGLVVRRGAITTHVEWRAVKEVTEKRGFMAIKIDGSDALIIPDSWFGKDKSAREAFHDAMKQGGRS